MNHKISCIPKAIHKSNSLKVKNVKNKNHNKSHDTKDTTALRGFTDAVDRPRLKVLDLTAVRFPTDFEVRVGVFGRGRGGGGAGSSG